MKARKALIFDFDGVIADTEPLHYRAFQEVLEPAGMGYSWKEYMDQYLGFDDRDALYRSYTRAKKKPPDEQLNDLTQRKAVAFERLVACGVVKPYPGVVDLGAQARVPTGRHLQRRRALGHRARDQGPWHCRPLSGAGHGRGCALQQAGSRLLSTGCRAVGWGAARS